MKFIALGIVCLACWGFYEQGKIIGVSGAMMITAQEYEGRRD